MKTDRTYVQRRLAEIAECKAKAQYGRRTLRVRYKELARHLRLYGAKACHGIEVRES